MCFLKTLSYKYLPRKKQLKCVVAWCTFKCALKLPTKWEIMKMMEHLKIHVQCKRHRLLFPTESQSHWLHWLGFLLVCAFSHLSHLFYVDYFQRSLEGVSPNIYKTTQLAHFGLLTTMVAFVCDISTVFLQMLSQIIHPRR